jgi:MFS family permease
VELGPVLAFGLLGGALADAHDRRRLVRAAELGLAGVSAALAANALLPRAQIWVLYVAAAAMAALTSVHRPALDAMTPRLVPRDELPAASALHSLWMNVGMIAGPAIGGLLVATAGLPATYLLDVGSFAVSLVLLTTMRPVPAPAGAERPSLRRVVEGLRFARSRPELMGTYLVDLNAMFFGIPTALFPAVAERYGGAGVLGLLHAAPSIGSFLAAATSGWTGRVHRHGRAVLWAAGLYGVAVAGFGLSGGLLLALGFLAAAGAADMVSGLFRTTIWNQTAPDAMRGRLAGIELISYSAGPLLGSVESGTVASLTSVRTSIVSGGALCALGTALLAAALPRFAAYDARVHAATAAPEREAAEPAPA